MRERIPSATEKGGLRPGDRTLNDLSQLTKSMIKPKEDPKPKAPPAPMAEGAVDRDAEEVLAYFSRPARDALGSPRVAPTPKPTEDRVAALEAALEAKDAALNAIAEEKVVAEERIAELERQLAAERTAHAASERERGRLQGECGRLQGELRKKGEDAPVPAPVEAAPVVRSVPPKPAQGILAAPGAVAEVFPGEVREQVVATLLDGLGSAERSGRERRAEILRCVLAANQSAGELERRRVELRQILKDAGYYNDPKPLERLGLRLISGRTHWKLRYANVRVTMSKTPSDYRAKLNNGNEIANRCF